MFAYSFCLQEYGSSLYMKVIRSRSRSQEHEGRKSLFPQTSLVSNSPSIKHRAMKFVCSMGFSAMEDQIVCLPSLTCDPK